MASIRITEFGGLLSDTSARLLPVVHATVAHNCLLWDGTLRPQADWIQLWQKNTDTEKEIRGVAFFESRDWLLVAKSFDPLIVDGQPFLTARMIGAGPDGNVCEYRLDANAEVPINVALASVGIGGNVVWTPQFLSTKGVQRTYGATRVRVLDNAAAMQESALTVLPEQPTDVVYDGDLAEITVSVANVGDGATHVRIYRSVSGFTTGEALNNALDTNWHLLAQVPIPASGTVVYNDGASTSLDQFDVYYSGGFLAPDINAQHFGLTESGWFVVTDGAGKVAVSEKFLQHAWPPENYFNIEWNIKDVAVSSDNVYIGTDGPPYIMAIASGDAPMQGALTPYEDFYPCLPGSMVATPSGALYASDAGIVVLGREGLRPLSEGIANPGDVLYSGPFDSETGTTEARIIDTEYGAYHAGWYYGFCKSDRISYYYLTTDMYPLYVEEQLASAVTIQEMRLYVVATDVYPEDFVRPTISYDDIEFYEPPLPTDGLELGLEVVSMELNPVIYRTNQFEEFTAGALVIDVTYGDGIVYRIPEESIESAVEIQSVLLYVP